MKVSTETAVKKIGKFLQKEKPYLFEIDKAVKEFNNGVITLDLRVYKGFVTDVVVHKSKRVVFKRRNVDGRR